MELGTAHVNLEQLQKRGHEPVHERLSVLDAQAFGTSAIGHVRLGLVVDEVAEVLGSSEKAIKSMVHRARENLRARLAPYLLEEHP